ncbi:MAG: RNase P modulator RnpM [bacterium]
MSVHQPVRTCLACRQKKFKHELLRIVRTPEGNVEIDVEATKSGRGAYLCYKIECFRTAMKRKSINQNLNVNVDSGFYEKLMKLLNGKN